MIEVTEAVKLARQFFNDIYQDEEINNLKLEEVVFDDDNNQWRITLGYDSHASKEIRKISRVYKVFHIDAENGDFKGMFIRIVG